MWKSKSEPADFGFVRSERRNAIGIGSMRSPQAAKIRVQLAKRMQTVLHKQQVKSREPAASRPQQPVC